MKPAEQTKNTEFSRFLRAEVARVAARGPKLEGQCEIVAVLPVPSAKAEDKTGQKNSQKTTRKSSVLVRKGFEDYHALAGRLADTEEISSKPGATCLVRFAGVRGADHVLFVGAGSDKSGVNALGAAERLRRLGAQVAHKLSAEKSKSATVYLESFLGREAALAVAADLAAYAFLEGMGLASYRFDKYFSKPNKKKDGILSVTLVAPDASSLSKYTKGLDTAKALVRGAEICRDLGNEPSNELHPALYADRAKEISIEHGLKISVLDERNLAKEKMGLLLGVGQGSVNPPRLIVMEYAPPRAKKTIAFVGKGITFDSGGISIKPSSRMEDMKHDMCGSAAVAGAIAACARLELPVRVIAIIAAAENMPDGKAIQPGNILRGRNGKTVEVTNTDAEGRLVLADALDYTQDMKPDFVIDLATLTGAATITLGKVCAGLMGNDARFNRMVKDAAAVSGERVWELPLFDEYFDDLKSDYADMRNAGDTPANGTAKGAMFLQQFIRKETKWVHLDIASVAYAIPHIPYNPKKSSTGYGVRLLVNLAKNLK